MRKIIVMALAIGFLFTTSVASVNATISEDDEESIVIGFDEEEFVSIEGQLYGQGGTYDGYTLFNPMLSRYTYLINDEGQVLNTWESDYIQSLPAYLLEDGSILRSSATSAYPLWFIVSGASGRIERFSWDGDLIWEFTYYGEDYCLHHDIEVLPNGHILMMAWEFKTLSEALLAGVKLDAKMILFGGLIIDYVIEVEPTANGGNIVWEWHLWDHIIQDDFPLRANYGAVNNHPELLDINLDDRKVEITHCNSIEYNEELDQIMLTSRHLSEIFIIDHSTTTTQAAGHTGGNSGKGGDLLYRWGNPRNYGAGDESNQILFGPHDARFVEEGCPGEGHVTIFNNGWEREGPEYSSVIEIELPSTDNNGNYPHTIGSSYGPEVPVWSYTADIPTDFYSSMMSGAQRLPNGNTLVCSATQGWFFEVTPQNDVVWEYSNNYPAPLFNDVFRVQQYSSCYEGLNNLNLDEEEEVLPSAVPGLMDLEEDTITTTTPDITNTEDGVSEQSSSSVSSISSTTTESRTEPTVTSEPEPEVTDTQESTSIAPATDLERRR